MDWFDHIRAHTEGLAAIAEQTDPAIDVPTCPGWTMADLVWHLLDVQTFWEHVITNRPIGPETYSEPPRPSDADLPAGLRSACERLVAALEVADPADEAWSWSYDHTVGFTNRRQAHEAFVHLADAAAATMVELTEVDPVFAADGVDEILQFNLAGIPEWATFDADAEVVRLVGSDVDRTWTLRFGRMSGTSPATGTVYSEEPMVECVNDLGDVDPEPDAVLAAPAAELDLWLWGRRPDHVVTVTGEVTLARRLRELARDATQ